MSKINFKIDSYQIPSPGQIIIVGQKVAPPSKRITLHQKNIKASSAKIIYKSKKGEIEFEVSRINRIKSIGEVRLHTKNILYPGIYELELDYSGNLNEDTLKN